MTTEMTELLTLRIDEALEQYRGRDLIAGSEITDLLLDLRLMLLAADVAAGTPSAS
jgi:signal recognition particle GTPase